MKLHKVPVGLRWIAGASAVELANGTWYATTSTGQSAAALGGILHQVMAVLRRKDERLFRQTGVRRYWIITSAEEAAGRLKCLNPRLLGRIWTRDFSAMYTSLPRERLVTQVSEAVHEAFCAQAAALNLEAEKLGMSVKYDYKKKATAEFEIGGRFTEQDIRQLLETVLEGTLLQQGPSLEVLEQKQGIPMGGKASAEIANLYCYNVEATTVAKAMQDYGLPAARKYATCMRFIDDLIGFGEISWPSLHWYGTRRDSRNGLAGSLPWYEDHQARGLGSVGAATQRGGVDLATPALPGSHVHTYALHPKEHLQRASCPSGQDNQLAKGI
jgi:hypothetical protein